MANLNDPAGRMVYLLGWNPDATPDPARSAVVEYGVTMGFVRLQVAKYYGPETHGGLMTPGDAERLGYELVRLADLARKAGATPAAYRERERSA